MEIVSITISKKKGTRKNQVEEALLKKGHGLEGDAHAGDWHRQVSFLSAENIALARAQGLAVTFGDFAENIATVGIAWENLPVGTKVQLGERAVVEITQIGKECHNKCAIYYQAGDCIMPKKGVFGRVLEGGTIRCGDGIKLIP
ncbi:MAG: MOSC domain-containing protein [Deltaproteobacteria bacterium]|nr:MOSC domain-containing protein [Candidatus Anaeroferrophillus wilburensis]MBN2888803.1 MOSC domain-containing protein [Deltaproteobacteria bacterium]